MIYDIYSSAIYASATLSRMYEYTILVFSYINSSSRRTQVLFSCLYWLRFVVCGILRCVVCGTLNTDASIIEKDTVTYYESIYMHSHF